MKSGSLEKDVAQYHVAVVIPAYRVAAHLSHVIESIPWYVRTIVVVDDGSPDNPAEILRTVDSSRLVLVAHEQNRGVGAAMMTGFTEALRRGAQICVKIDGDGQMDPALIAKFCRPIILGEADYVKGNRFMSGGCAKHMPLIRKFGNLGLSFMLKMASGYWRIFDPANGYVAVRKETLESLNWDWIAHDYFFESSMLIALHTSRAVVRDFPLEARYAGEASSLNPWRVLRQFPVRLLWCYLRRIWFEYFQYDFGLASLLMLVGVPLLLVGTGLGILYWHRALVSGTQETGGEVMLSALPVLASIQMLIQALALDMDSIAGKSQYGPLLQDENQGPIDVCGA